MSSLLLAIVLVAAPAAPQDKVRVMTIEAQSFDGTWLGITADGAIQLETDDGIRNLRPDSLVQIRWENRKERTKANHYRMVVHTKEASRLNANLISTEGNTLVFETDLISKLPLSLSRLAAIHKAEGDKDVRQALDRAVSQRHPSEDTLIVQREGRVRVLQGVTESLSKDGGAFRWRNRTIPIDWNITFGIVFATGIQQPKRQPARCVLADGSIWAGKLTGGDKNTVRLALANETTVPLAIDRLIEIRFVSDRVVFLDEIKPAAYLFEPFASVRWPYRLNRSVANRPMRIGDERFDRGIGVHSRSILEYEMKDAFKQLSATIGIDEAVGDLGHVIFRVHADDKVVFDSGPVTGHDEPRPVLVPIEGAKRLKLEVDFGEALDVGDQANWANVRLIK